MTTVESERKCRLEKWHLIDAHEFFISFTAVSSREMRIVTYIHAQNARLE